MESKSVVVMGYCVTQISNRLLFVPFGVTVDGGNLSHVWSARPDRSLILCLWFETHVLCFIPDVRPSSIMHMFSGVGSKEQVLISTLKEHIVFNMQLTLDQSLNQWLALSGPLQHTWLCLQKVWQLGQKEQVFLGRANGFLFILGHEARQEKCTFGPEALSDGKNLSEFSVIVQFVEHLC